MKNVEIVAKAFIEAGEKARNSFSKSRLSNKVSAKLKTLTKDARREQLSVSSENDNGDSKERVELNASKTSAKENKRGVETKLDNDNLHLIYTKSTSFRHKENKLRPKSAPINQVQKSRSQLLFQNRSTKIDHRKSSLKIQLRPRTPGSLVYVVNEDGGFQKEEDINEK